MLKAKVKEAAEAGVAVPKFPVWLTEKEGEALLFCLDAAVKARGLEVVKAVAVIAQKVEEGRGLMRS